MRHIVENVGNDCRMTSEKKSIYRDNELSEDF